jgi:hypothetical protein
MASDDNSLIAEARALTDYGTSVYSDSEFQELVDIGKEELRASLDAPDFTFYTNEHHNATRALFWFVCIAAKVRAGEISGVNITVGDFETQNPASIHYDYWFDNFQQRMQSAYRETDAGGGPSQITLSRNNRTYGE